MALARSTHRVRAALAAAGLPLASAALVLVGEIDPHLWFAMPEALTRRAAADALVVESVMVVVAAPLAAVAWVSRQRANAGVNAAPAIRGRAREAWGEVAPLVEAALVMLAVSALGMAAAWGIRDGALEAIAVSHATLGAAILALVALGAWCASSMRDALDAAALAAVVALAAATTFVAAGPALAGAPTAVIDATLLASPVVSTAATAGLDLVRTEPLYRLTPVAHRQFTYPEWYAACAAYLIAAMFCFAGVVRSLRWRAPDRPWPSRGLS